MEHSTAVIVFGPFRLVVDKRELWKNEVLLKVWAMPLAVLTYFAQHPERVIAVEEVRKAIWGGTQVGRGAVWVCVQEIRQALGDEATTPRHVETVDRQDYRFVGYRFSTPLAAASPASGATRSGMLSGDPQLSHSQQGNLECGLKITDPALGRSLRA